MRKLLAAAVFIASLPTTPTVFAQGVTSVVTGAPELPPNIDIFEARKGARQFPFPPCITCPDIPLVQRELSRLGYRPGPIDGISGPLTRAAIRAFQRDNGLAVDGIASAELLRTLLAR